MIAREIYEPLYDVRVHIIAKCNQAQANKKIEKLFGFDPELDPRAYGTIIEHRDGKHFIIWIKRADNDSIEHEVSHMLDSIYAYREIKHDPNCQGCSEHRAYHMGWCRIIRAALK